MQRNAGYTYVEVLMAAALLSIFAMPILAGFLNGAQNQRYAREAYEAALYASNLLTEAAVGWPSPDPAAIPTDLPSLLRNPAFDTEYRTDQFDYCLYLYDGDSLIARLCTDPDLAVSPPPSPPGLTGGSPLAYSPISVTGPITLTDSADLMLPDGVPVSVACENSTDTPIVINISADDPDLVALDCDPANGDITVFFSSPPPAARLLMAEVYNKNGTLLNRLAVPMQELP